MASNLEEIEKLEEAPLYRRIENALRTRITRGAWLEGQALPSRRQLCLEFSTTRVTLDKAIQGLVREGLLSSAKGSGTFVSRPSQARRVAEAERATGAARRAFRIGVVLGRETPESADGVETDNFYIGPLFSGIRASVAARGVEIAYARVPDGDYLRFYMESSLDAIVLMTPTLGDLPVLRRLVEAQVPFVALSVSPGGPEDAMLSSIDTDNRHVATVAVEHLIDLGHKEIALVNLALSHGDHLDRMEGYLRAMASHGLLVDPRNLVLYPTYDIIAFEPCIDLWLTQAEVENKVPTAILACDYMMTLATLRVLRQHRLRVPEDVSLIGFDDPLSAEHLTPPLTTVRQPVYQIGRRAVDRLIEHLQGQPGTQALTGAEILPSELVVRESTMPPRAVDRAERTL